MPDTEVSSYAEKKHRGVLYAVQHLMSGRIRITRAGVELSRSKILALPAPLWGWLREHGVTRPSPSGKSGTTQTAESRRAAGRVRLEVWIDKEVADRLDELAAGSTRSATIARLVREA